jgi:hypothetical protein
LGRFREPASCWLSPLRDAVQASENNLVAFLHIPEVDVFFHCPRIAMVHVLQFLRNEPSSRSVVTKVVADVLGRDFEGGCEAIPFRRAKLTALKSFAVLENVAQ